MKKLFLCLFLALLAFPLTSQAADQKKDSSFFQDLKQAGKEAKEAAKDVGKEVKKDVKQAGEDIKKTGREANKDLKEKGKTINKDTKKTGKSFKTTLKKSLKSAGEGLSDAWNGFLNFLGFGSKDKGKKKDNPTEKAGLAFHGTA